MYLVSVLADQSRVEASLGGRVTAEEIEVLGEEIVALSGHFNGRAYDLLLDYSKAKTLDREASYVLADMKAMCLSSGVRKIVSVPSDEQQMVRHTSLRLQAVLEGFEEFVFDPSKAQFDPVGKPARRAA